MAEVKGRVVAVWCHAEVPGVFCGWVDFLQFIPHKRRRILDLDTPVYSRRY